MLVLKRIHVAYHLEWGERPQNLRSDGTDAGEAVERAHRHHKEKCPVYRSIRDAIAVTTELRFGP